ncbi:MAG TPA: type II secretion system protein [Terriglobia bacterium]|nr:type II secretion system protein [Terriglobia bacterium]
MRTRNSGYSLIEMMAVCLLVSIGSRVAMTQIKGSMNLIDADIAANTVSSQIQYARQMAIDERRNMQIDFLGTNEIKITRQDSGGGTTVMSDVTLPVGYSFALPTSFSNDTPEGFGNSSAVYFNAGTSGLFLADGTFVSAVNVLTSGTVFTKGAGNQTARAVTLTAATGRVKTYWIVGANWALR